MVFRAFFVLLSMGLYLPAAMAQERIVAEVFSYPFKPVTLRTVHYRLLASGEGQLAIVSPDGSVESVQALMQLTPDRTKAMLASIERINSSVLRSAPKKNPDQCTSGGGEFSVFNVQGETQLIAKIENCAWSESVQPEAQIIVLILQSLQGIGHLY